MQLISLSKLNIAYGLSFGRALIGQVKSWEQRTLVARLYVEGQTINQRSKSLRSYCTQSIKYPIGLTSSLFCCVLPKKAMSAWGSSAFSGDVYVDSLMTGSRSVIDLGKAATVYFGDRSVHSCRRANISLRNQGSLTVQLGISCDTHRSWDSKLFLRPVLRQYHASCSASDGTAVDVPFEVSAREEHTGNSSDSPARNHVGLRTLKLQSGSCYLPHPDKVKTGGEDAHFICEEKQVIGVADGVGGWADVGVDAGLYARLLMSNSVTAVKEEPKGAVDPAKVLEKAHADTKVIGSSTACIVALTNKGIHAINLGDSAFIVIRDGTTVFRSPVQQYGFNFPYQLANGNGGDLPSSGQVFSFPVASGDVIVVGTDGLFDNLYDNEISALVVQAMRSGVKPEVTAHNIANLAQQRGLDRKRQTPFSAAAHDAGFRYIGGKLDDVTVVVSYITGLNNQ